jgi:hypothetical protein
MASSSFENKALPSIIQIRFEMKVMPGLMMMLGMQSKNGSKESDREEWK